MVDALTAEDTVHRAKIMANTKNDIQLLKDEMSALSDEEGCSVTQGIINRMRARKLSEDIGHLVAKLKALVGIDDQAKLDKANKVGIID